MIKILIVEDQTMLRQSLEHLLNGQDDMEVVGGTDDAAKSLELCKKLNPDLVLMDVVTKNISTGIYANGIRYTAEIHKELPDIKIVIMTGLPEITFAEEAKKAGANSFINKEMDNEHLLHVIRSTMKGVNIYSGPAGHQPFAGKFTDKEIEVIRLVCQGMTPDEMAKKMNISEAMIGKHITSILDKTGFDNIMKFSVYAVGQGFVAPEIH